MPPNYGMISHTLYNDPVRVLFFACMYASSVHSVVHFSTSMLTVILVIKLDYSVVAK